MNDTGGGFSREDLLAGGMGGRKVSVALFAIENRVHQLLNDSRRAAAGWEATTVDQRRQSDYFGSMAAGRDRSTRPSSFHLERYAHQWADLVPEHVGTRVALLELLARTYDLPYRSIPGIRRSFGTEDPDFSAELQRRTGQTPAKLLAAKPTVVESVQWLWTRLASRIERLSAFWITFAMVITGTVGGGVLAVPLVLSQFDVVAGTLILLIGATASSLGMVAFVEAIIRSDPDEPGGLTIGSLTRRYLGRRTALIVTILLTIDMASVIVASVYAFGRNMGDSTGAPEAIWAVVLALMLVALVRRESLDATVAVALVLGALTLALLVGLIAIAGVHTTSGNLRDGASILDVRGREAALFAALFGYSNSLYTAQVGVLNSSVIALRREPSGRQLRYGTLTAIALSFVLYALFFVTVHGAIPAGDLIGQTATAIGPLADRAGPIAAVVGSFYAPLAIGLVALQFAIGMKNQVRDWTSGLPYPDVMAAVPTVVCAGLGIAFLGSSLDIFVEAFSFTGALIVPLTAALVPALLLFASRQRGTRWPGPSRARWIGTVLAVVTVVFYVAGLVLHGTVVWQRIEGKILAFAALALAALIGLAAVRTGRFRPLLYVAFEQGGTASGMHRVSLLESGEPCELSATLWPANETTLRHGSVVSRTDRPVTVELPGLVEVAIRAATEPAASVTYLDSRGRETSLSPDAGGLFRLPSTASEGHIRFGERVIGEKA